MLSSIKLNISNFLLKREVLQKSCVIELLPLSKVKCVGVLFDSEKQKDLIYIKQLLKYFLDNMYLNKKVSIAIWQQ